MIPKWSKPLDELISDIERIQEMFSTRCKQLNVSEEEVREIHRQEIIARAVHESNWQEGMRLDEVRTNELTGEAYCAARAGIGHLRWQECVDSQ